MNGSAGAKERLVADCRSIGEHLPGRDAPWLRALRGAALTRFDEVGFPTPRQEDWKYTSVAPIELA